MKTYSLRLVTLAICASTILTAQAADNTRLKQVIIFGRHSVRSAGATNQTIDPFAVQPYPVFIAAPPPPAIPVPQAGYLTANGASLETILGGYYRLWLTNEGLLTGNDPADSAFVYFHSNNLERTILTAQSFWRGMLPAAGAPNVSYVLPQTSSDPLFDPVGAGVATLDQQKAIAAVEGRLGGNPQALAAAYASEYALTRSILFGYPVSQTPAPPAPTGTVDVTAIPIEVTAASIPVSLGGLTLVAAALDPFLMEYTDGLPASQIGWGELTAAGISQLSRIYNLPVDLEFRTPYLGSVQSSNVASHVVRSLVQAATGISMAGALGNPSTKVVVLIASDVNIAGLGGLFHLDWLLPEYQQDFCPPGGALVFELRQSQTTGEYIVRASYIVQTMDQLRNQTVLTMTSPPANVPIFIPGCSMANATFDCPLAKFVKLANQVIDPQSADLVN